MNLKTSLDALTMETAVLGGAVLSCGGGGKLEDGLQLGQYAEEQGPAALQNLEYLSSGHSLAFVSLLHASPHTTHQLPLRYGRYAIDLLQSHHNLTIDKLVNGSQGAVDTIFGWALAGNMGLPLLDAGIPLQTHPEPLSNLLALLPDASDLVLAIVGNSQNGLDIFEDTLQGTPKQLRQGLIEFTAQHQGSFVSTLGGMTPQIAAELCVPGTVTQALTVGQTLLAYEEAGGWETAVAISKCFPNAAVHFGTVTELTWHKHPQNPYGQIDLLDENGRCLQLTYQHRYTGLKIDNKPAATFPDLITTLGSTGTPLTGEEVSVGQDIFIIVSV